MRQLKPIELKILKYAGYPLFYLVCLIAFVRVTFPYDTLRTRLLAEFNGRGGDKRLEIEELSGHWLFGVDAENARLVEIVAAPTEEKKVPLALHVDRLKLSVSPLGLLFGNIGVSFDAEVGGGNVSGSFSQSDTEAKIAVHGEEVDIAGLTLLSAGLGLPLGGTLAGDVDLVLPERKMSAAVGKFELSIADFVVGDGKAKVLQTIALPKLSAGNFALKAEATDGYLDVSEFGSDGKDLFLTAAGRIRLREPFDRSNADLDVTFRFKEAYTNKNDITKSLFGSSESKVPGLFDMDPNVKRAKDKDGSYRWRVIGQLSKPTFRPGGSSKSRTKAGAEKPAD